MMCSPRRKRLIIDHAGKRVPPSEPSDRMAERMHDWVGVCAENQVFAHSVTVS